MHAEYDVRLKCLSNVLVSYNLIGVLVAVHR